jgi:adenosylhomocysteine nucleosidase
VLGIVTGLAAEARLARRLGQVAVGGGTSAGALAAAEAMTARGATALLSLGLAGGLDPTLRAGDIVAPETVLVGDDAYPTDPDLKTALGPSAGRSVLDFDAVVSGGGYKAMLFRDTGACAVDLESGAVARVAARHGLPFAVLRAVCDPADRTLTPAALVGLDANGGMAVWRVLAALLHQPGELPALLALARDAGAARKSLLGRVAEIRRRGGMRI